MAQTQQCEGEPAHPYIHTHMNT